MKDNRWLYIATILALLTLFVGGARANDIKNWVEITDDTGFQARGVPATFELDGKVWVVGGVVTLGTKKDSWHSINGIDWTQTDDVLIDTVMGTTLNGYGYIFENGGDEVYRMTNGTDWEAVTLNAETDFKRVIQFNGKMYNIVGNGEVWNSTDGASWTNNTKNAEYNVVGDRSNVFTATSYNNKMWVIGGKVGGTYLNDVWSSTNGIDWVAVTRNAEFSVREKHSSFIWNDKLWVVGGSAGSSPLDDTWSSTEGVTWTQDTDLFDNRNAMGKAEINGYAVLIGGYSGAYENDVWMIIANNNSPTITPTNTSDVTVTITPSFTITVTNTPTPTPTVTMTSSPTNTPFITWTQSVTSTISPTITLTATITITATRTITSTNTPVVTATPTQTNTLIVTPELEDVEYFGNDANTGTTVRVQWTKYEVNDIAYDLAICDQERQITETLPLKNSDDISNYKGLFTYDINHLKWFGKYCLSVTAKSGSWDGDQVANGLIVRPGFSPTPSPTPLRFCFDVGSGQLENPISTNSATFIDTGLQVGVNIAANLGKLVIFTSFGSQSTVGAVDAEYKLIVDGQESYALEAHYSGTNDKKLGTLIDILQPSVSGAQTIKLQYRRSSAISSRFVEVSTANMVAVAIESSDGSIIFNSSKATLDSTGEETGSTTYVDVEGLSTTVFSDVDGDLFGFANFNAKWGATETDSVTGNWRLTIDSTPVACPISRTASTTDDKAIVPLQGVLKDATAGQHTIVVQQRVDTAGDTITTYNGMVGIIAMTDDEGAPLGVRIPVAEIAFCGEESTSATSPTNITNSANTIYIPEGLTGRILTGAIFNTKSADATGNTREGSYSVDLNFITATGEYTRSISSDVIAGAGGVYGNSGLLTAGTYQGFVNHHTDNASNPVTTENVIFQMTSGCAEPIPSPTP